MKIEVTEHVEVDGHSLPPGHGIIAEPPHTVLRFPVPREWEMAYRPPPRMQFWFSRQQDDGTFRKIGRMPHGSRIVVTRGDPPQRMVYET